MQNILKKLIEKNHLNEEDISSAFKLALNGQNPIQVAAFLALLEAKGVTSSELFWALKFMEGQASLLKTSFPVLDIVGTGGDHSNTFNISTGTAFLTAACGVKVAKHGNRSVSSNSGSVDVLEALGVEMDLTEEGYLHCLEELGLVFLPAPRFHPAMKALREIRSQLKIRTLLNLMGPLLNPACAQYQLVGVYKEELLDLVSGALFKQKKKALVVNSQGIDELTPLGPAHVRIVSKEGVKAKTIDPHILGIPKCTLKEIQGRDPSSNAKKLIEVLKGGQGPWADTLILNTSAALFLRGEVLNMQEGVDLAKKQLETGTAFEILKALQDITKKHKRKGS